MVLGLLLMIEVALEKLGLVFVACGLLWVLFDRLWARWSVFIAQLEPKPQPQPQPKARARSRRSPTPRPRRMAQPPAGARVFVRARPVSSSSTRGTSMYDSPIHDRPLDDEVTHGWVREEAQPIHRQSHDADMPEGFKSMPLVEPSSIQRAIQTESEFAAYNDSGMPSYDDTRHL